MSTLPISHSIFNLHSQLLRILSYFRVYKKREPLPSHHCFSKHRNTSIALPLLLLFPHHQIHRASSHCRYTHPHLQSMFEGDRQRRYFEAILKFELTIVLLLTVDIYELTTESLVQEDVPFWHGLRFSQPIMHNLIFNYVVNCQRKLNLVIGGIQIVVVPSSQVLTVNGKLIW
ncbi:hypothetical protein L2E82_10562 [Cichorium intybus]|uniref:Uncharacterized protein n=1 Tax=Cichorium intybus TaxID=13427 RepID=A0ACB9GAR5_CICIN|nr:hypothetical protein L2E82_10562 [Cichorium intybus]